MRDLRTNFSYYTRKILNENTMSMNSISNDEKEEPKEKHETSTQVKNDTLLPEARIYKVVLTGGPCGGKTTALARLSCYLRERGFEVFTVPEAFSLLVSNGFTIDYFTVDGMPFHVQNSVMDLQISLEDSVERLLKARGKPGVILCDRGLMDGSAYMNSEEWDSFLRNRGVSSAEIREGRYNAVFHLVTCAEGAEKFYTLENNEARSESPEDARKLDISTRKAWVGHHNLMVLDNSTDFEGKLNKLVSATSKLVGLPTTIKSMNVKFLLRGIPDLDTFPIEVKYQIFEVEKVYLYDRDIKTQENSTNLIEEYSFIRKRSHMSFDNEVLGTTYQVTTVKVYNDGKNIEEKRIISAREYNASYHTRDTSRNVILQKRISFLYKTQSFNIHIYKKPMENLCIANAQVAASEIEKGNIDGKATKDIEVDIPPFLDVQRRLQSNQEDYEKYSSFHISLLKK